MIILHCHILFIIVLLITYKYIKRKEKEVVCLLSKRSPSQKLITI